MKESAMKHASPDPTDIARALLAYETLIYSSERMLIFSLSPTIQDYGLALYNSLVPINTALKRLICTSILFRSLWFVWWLRCDFAVTKLNSLRKFEQGAQNSVNIIKAADEVI